MADSTFALELPPLALYVHLPWCVKKCPYCDFNSHAIDRASDLPEAAYITALLADLAHDAPMAQHRKLQSVFFGGGTPSLFSAAAIARILDAAERQIGFVETPEITLEANPGTLDHSRFPDFLAAGINRLSIGVQSFDDSHLATLGRVHDSAAARRALDQVRDAGFNNYNIDLMYGLPGQSPAQARADIEQALACSPSHLSWYELTIEPNTAFYSRPPQLPNEDTLLDITATGLAALREAGFTRYEISAFARDARLGEHNLNYWQFGDYLGIGAGAHGKITLGPQQRIIRTAKTRQPEAYMKSLTSALTKIRILQADELPVEYFMNALRLCEGVPKAHFSQRTGLSFSRVEATWQQLVDLGLVAAAGTTLKPTPRGLSLLNEVIARF